MTPDWASDYVRTSLDLDVRVPAIEQRLVERGLTPAEATVSSRTNEMKSSLS